MGVNNSRGKKQRLRWCHIFVVLAAMIANGILCGSTLRRDPDATYDVIIDTPVSVRQMTQPELHRGNLLLVNRDYEYDPETAWDLVPIYEGMNDAYFVKSVDLMLNREALTALNQWMQAYYEQTSQGNVNVVAGHRTTAEQQILYENALLSQGETYAAAYFNNPGYSEHHTGLAVDFGTWDPETRTAGDFSGLGDQMWLLENAWRYGFVQRYPAQKQSVTGIAYESWHFRYVGVPHAWYMTQNDLVLEEYLTLLRQYSFDQPLRFTVEGCTYQVYYCSGLTVPLPDTEVFEISGDNIGGFVITYVVK